MAVLIAPFDPSILYYIQKELTVSKVSRIEIVAYPSDDLKELRNYFGEKLLTISVADFTDALIKIAQHVSESKNSYIILLTQTSPIELTTALLLSFSLLKKDATLVIYTGGKRILIDGKLFSPIELNEKELSMLKAISEGKYKVEELAKLSKTSNATASRVRNKLEREGYISRSGGKYELTLKGRVALEITDEQKMVSEIKALRKREGRVFKNLKN